MSSHEPSDATPTEIMKATQKLHDLGQSLWLDNITRDLLDSGTLERYIDELSVTGLTSNPTIFDHAIKNSTAYDAAIRDGRWRRARSGEALFFDLALEDLTRAADLFRPDLRPDQRRGRLGVAGGVAAAGLRHREHARRGQGSARPGGAGPICSSRSPARKEGLPAIEEAIFAGVPVNVTLLFSREQYVAAAEAYHARHRAAHRRRAQSRGRLRGLAVHQPLGRRGRRQGAGGAAATSSASPSPSAPTRRTASCSARRAGSASTTPAPGRNACCGPAPAPRTRKPPTCSTSRRWPRRSR